MQTPQFPPPSVRIRTTVEVTHRREMFLTTRAHIQFLNQVDNLKVPDHWLETLANDRDLYFTRQDLRNTYSKEI